MRLWRGCTHDGCGEIAGDWDWLFWGVRKAVDDEGVDVGFCVGVVNRDDEGVDARGVKKICMRVCVEGWVR